MSDVKWADVFGFPDYRINTDGVIVGKYGTILRSAPNGRGYPCVCLYGGGKKSTKPVHRLVLLTFVGPCPDGMECLHGDGDRKNHRLDNLRWGTPAENAEDMMRHGTHVSIRMREGRMHTAKLSERDVLEIRELAASGRTFASIAKQFHMGKWAIGRIVTGKTWKYLLTSVSKN